MSANELDVIARYAEPQGEVPDLNDWPLNLYHGRVHDDWIDYNGHMNEAFSVFVSGYACDALARLCGAMPQGAMYSAETHVCYHKEVHRQAKFRLTGRLLNLWSKRWQALFLLYVEEDESPSVSIEQMSIYTEQGRVAVLPDPVYTTLEAILARHQQQPASPFVGRRIGDPKVRV